MPSLRRVFFSYEISASLGAQPRLPATTDQVAGRFFSGKVFRSRSNPSLLARGPGLEFPRAGLRSKAETRQLPGVRTFHTEFPALKTILEIFNSGSVPHTIECQASQC